MNISPSPPSTSGLQAQASSDNAAPISDETSDGEALKTQGATSSHVTPPGSPLSDLDLLATEAAKQQPLARKTTFYPLGVKGLLHSTNIIEKEPEQEAEEEEQEEVLTKGISPSYALEEDNSSLGSLDSNSGSESSSSSTSGSTSSTGSSSSPTGSLPKSVVLEDLEAVEYTPSMDHSYSSSGVVAASALANARTKKGKKIINRKERVCPLCNKFFPKKGDLTRHQAAHSELKSFQCSECPKSFKLLASLREHMQRMHLDEKTHKCTRCEFAFIRNSELKKHMIARHSDKQHRCGTCDKSFSTKGSLQSHLLIHSAEKLFVCMECGKSFARKTSLSNHKKVHSDKKPYSCTCNRAYKTLDSLKRHKQGCFTDCHLAQVAKSSATASTPSCSTSK